MGACMSCCDLPADMLGARCFESTKWLDFKPREAGEISPGCCYLGFVALSCYVLDSTRQGKQRKERSCSRSTFCACCRRLSFATTLVDDGTLLVVDINH